MHRPALPPALRAACLLAACALAACRDPVERVFEYSSDGPSRTGLVATPAGAVMGNEGGALVLLGYDGKPVWRVLLGRAVAARPVATEDTVVAATLGGEWTGVSLRDGQERWRQPRPPQLSPLTTDGERVYSVGTNGAVEAFDVAGAAAQWSRPAPAGFAEDRRPLPAPLLLGETLYVALGEAGLVALRARDGELRWRLPKVSATALWGEGGRLYAATRGGEVLGLEAETGRAAWSHRVGPVTSGLCIIGGRLWLGIEGPRLLALRPEDGAEQWRAELPAPLVGRPVPYRELLVVPTAGREGVLLGLRPPQGRPAFQVRLDSPLRAEPLVRKDLLLVPAADGRVLGLRVNATPR